MSSQFIATLHSKHIFWDSWDNIFLQMIFRNPLQNVEKARRFHFLQSSLLQQKINSVLKSMDDDRGRDPILALPANLERTVKKPAFEAMVRKCQLALLRTPRCLPDFQSR